MSLHCQQDHKELCDSQVVRDFRLPEGATAEELDALGDGDLLVVLDLRADEGLSQARVAREVTTRVQKLRKVSLHGYRFSRAARPAGPALRKLNAQCWT